ncbi:MAG: chromate efflux transporter [Pseudomonadota bacterium]
MTDAAETKGHAGEVLSAFAVLGCTSFGGPIAHLGYFRAEFVERRRWLTEEAYAELVALCQFLPGPASSQVGFGLGWMRAGPLGALAAFLAFTLPSALLLVGVALGAQLFAGPVGAGVLDGLKLVAVAVVAQAVLGMARSLCPDRARASIAVVAVALIALLGAVGQIAAIAAGALAGLAFLSPEGQKAAPLEVRVAPALSILALILFLVLLVGLPLLAPGSIADAFYRSGALVFGGGHVVLPLLEAEVVGRGAVSEAEFLAGYGAAQAVPGPLFTFGAYLGTVMGGLTGAAIALAAIFLPGFLLLIGVLPFWTRLRAAPRAQAALAGANAAVVGVLGAALYDPVFTNAVQNPVEMTLALAGFVALVVWKAPALGVVFALATAGGLMGAFA